MGRFIEVSEHWVMGGGCLTCGVVQIFRLERRGRGMRLRSAPDFWNHSLGGVVVTQLREDDEGQYGS